GRLYQSINARCHRAILHGRKMDDDRTGGSSLMASIKVTVWNEYRHEKQNEHVASIYPEGIHHAIGGYLKTVDGFVVKTAVLDEPEHGLSDDVLSNTDVLIWWGHLA